MVLFLSAEGSRAACRSGMKCFFLSSLLPRLRSGLRQCGAGSFPQLTRHLHSLRSAQLVLRTGLFSVAPFGAALSRRLTLRGFGRAFRRWPLFRDTASWLPVAFRGARSHSSRCVPGYFQSRLSALRSRGG